MTRKDFNLIAETLNTASIPATTRAHLANLFANRLAETNPLFDRERFAAAVLKGN